VIESRLTPFLPLACVAAAVVLFASQLMTMFEFTPPGAEPLTSRSVIDHHGPGLTVIAVFGGFAAIVAWWLGSKPAALAVAAMGGLALLIFLLVDLPDAGQIGTLDDARQSFVDAEAVPQEGFWLELVGALALTLSGIALATLTPDQLGALRPGGAAGVRAPPPPAHVVAPPASTGSEGTGETHGRTARRRAHQRR
jgi:hypothetical protein